MIPEFLRHMTRVVRLTVSQCTEIQTVTKDVREMRSDTNITLVIMVTEERKPPQICVPEYCKNTAVRIKIFFY